ncbi:hypothetical protein KAH55_13450 [bacterium]|nr:hypothetical protein [bacterium]
MSGKPFTEDRQSNGISGQKGGLSGKHLLVQLQMKHFLQVNRSLKDFHPILTEISGISTKKFKMGLEIDPVFSYFMLTYRRANETTEPTT